MTKRWFLKVSNTDAKMFNMNLFNQGENKNVIDGLNNTLTKILQVEGFT